MSEATSTTLPAAVSSGVLPSEVKPVAPAAPSAPKSATLLHHFRVWLVRFLWLVLGVSGGLLLVARNPARASKLGFSGASNFKIVAHPAQGGEDIAIAGIAGQIAKASSQVVVLGGRLTSRKVLDVLASKASAGVPVTVIIPKGTAQKDVAYYLLKAGVKDIYLSPHDFDEQLLLIDGNAFVCTVPLSAKSAREMTGSIMVANDEATLAAIRNYLRERVLESSKLQ